MRAFILLLCLSVGCLAQRPKPCTSPSLFSGSFSVTSQREQLMVYARYSYDALRQRVFLKEFGSFKNQTFHISAILLYREGVMYQFSYRNRTCIKRPLSVDFQPLEVPKNASLMGQFVLGASSGPGQGVLVNAWAGEVPMGPKKAKYVTTVTVSGCIPLSNVFYTDQTGWLLTSFFNGVVGLVDPAYFIPPTFCQEAKLEMQEPVHFYNLFDNKV